MGERKPPWWSYVKHIVEEYPALCRELEKLKEQKVTGTYGERVSLKGRVCRPVETTACKTLSPNKQKKYEAVKKAIDNTKKRYPESAVHRLKMIQLVYFDKKYTIAGAAMRIPCHVNTAGHWHCDFIRLVAENLELP